MRQLGERGRCGLAGHHLSQTMPQIHPLRLTPVPLQPVAYQAPSTVPTEANGPTSSRHIRSRRSSTPTPRSWGWMRTMLS